MITESDRRTTPGRGMLPANWMASARVTSAPRLLGFAACLATGRRAGASTQHLERLATGAGHEGHEPPVRARRRQGPGRHRDHIGGLPGAVSARRAADTSTRASTSWSSSPASTAGSGPGRNRSWCRGSGRERPGGRFDRDDQRAVPQPVSCSSPGNCAIAGNCHSPDPTEDTRPLIVGERASVWGRVQRISGDDTAVLAISRPGGGRRLRGWRLQSGRAGHRPGRRVRGQRERRRLGEGGAGARQHEGGHLDVVPASGWCR